jgi:NodT family efflux transporter outer membrane factor (OMF) lipoprotein
VSVSERYTLSLSASYELDLWGKILNRRRAAVLDAHAARQDVESTAQVLAASVAEAYFQVLEHRAHMALVREQVNVNRDLLGLVELRFGQGLASAVDVYQQRQQLKATQAQLPVFAGRLAVSEHGLAVLLGRPPGEKAAGEGKVLPSPAPLPSTGVPADLLERRPDLRALRLRASAADERVASALADRLPSLRLTGEVGYVAPDPADIFKNWFYNIAAGVTAPLLDGGRRRSEVRRTEDVRSESLLRYGEGVLGAMREVEDALSREHHQRRYLRELREQIGIARANLRESRNRYVNGLSDYLPVLTALSALQQLERDEVTARRELLSNRTQLYLALGGSWSASLPEPAAPELGARRVSNTQARGVR